MSVSVGAGADIFFESKQSIRYRHIHINCTLTEISILCKTQIIHFDSLAFNPADSSIVGTEYFNVYRVKGFNMQPKHG
jgi:hypothetical protein